ncbi:hypothetical protein [Mycobacterium canetti]|uniref:hypothetical protein n=2 Tax=Mycobacterium canetti TaxID=78331 RepID=UPI0002A5ADC3|nr:hypothetical protein [Mycobacterium canetti]MBC9076467.1 hypothetical protein [Mycobacterium canetti]CCK56562.1 Conserved protein of unknown function [Mycobacterium canettii CIPT 140070008]
MNASESADKVVCECCELGVPKQLASAIRNPYGLVRGWRCRICNEHQGQPVKMAQDHEEEVRIRWGETVDELHAALDRADDYKAKMLAAFRSRDAVLREFEKLGRYHQSTGHGCLCGKRNCETLSIIDSNYIYGHVDRMNRRDELG